MFSLSCPVVHRMTNTFIVAIFSCTEGVWSDAVRRYRGFAIFHLFEKIPERNYNEFCRNRNRKEINKTSNLSWFVCFILLRDRNILVL